jgi:hypothetical protein
MIAVRVVRRDLALVAEEDMDLVPGNLVRVFSGEELI